MRISRDLGKVLSRAIDALRLLGSEPVSRPNRLETELRSKNAVLPTKLPQNTVVGCNDLAVADLLEASVSTDRDERKLLRRSADRWSQRANMLERLARSFQKRAALDEGSREYQRERERHRISASRQLSPSDD